MEPWGTPHEMGAEDEKELSVLREKGSAVEGRGKPVQSRTLDASVTFQMFNQDIVVNIVQHWPVIQ